MQNLIAALMDALREHIEDISENPPIPPVEFKIVEVIQIGDSLYNALSIELLLADVEDLKSRSGMLPLRLLKPPFNMKQPCDERNEVQTTGASQQIPDGMNKEIEKDFSVLYLPIWPIDATNAEQWNGGGWYVVRNLASNIFEIDSLRFDTYEQSISELNTINCQ